MRSSQEVTIFVCTGRFGKVTGRSKYDFEDLYFYSYLAIYRNMNSYKMLSASRAAITAIENAVNLMELVNSLAEMSDRACEVSGAYAVSNPSTHNTIRLFADEVGDRLKSTDIILVIKEIVEVETAISVLQRTSNIQSDSNLKVIEEISNFGNSFQKALQGYDRDNLISLVHAAKTVQSTLAVFTSSLGLFTHSIHPTHDLPAGYDQISIFLNGSTSSLKDILDKIEAIKNLYSELLSLLNLSEADYPLQVLKVESGSFWAWLAGSAGAISWMRQTIERAISFGYRNFTNEGKMVEGIPQKLRVLEQVIQVKETMKANGCDTSISDEVLKKSLIKISKQFENLIGQADSVEIDMESYSLLSRTSDQNLLSSGGSRLPLLGSASALEEDNSNQPD